MDQKGVNISLKKDEPFVGPSLSVGSDNMD
jgi:hypothetical protein